MTLTPETLDDLLRLREAGTQGEWAIDGIAIAHLSEPYGYPIDICLMGEPAQYPGDIPVMMQNHEANAALIAAAVNALPDLVAAARERDALRARVDELQSLVGRYINHVGECEGCDFLDDSTDWLTEAEREELKDMDVAAQIARAALEGRHE